MYKPFLYYFLFCLFGSNVIAQNLIYNGDFEIYDTCPIGASDPWQFPKQIEHCLGWNAPTYGTSDFFNTCAVSTNVSIPVNALGEQNPYNGNGYLGGFFTNYTGGAGSDGYSGIMWWEYVQGELIQPLEANKTYKLSMEISLAEYSDLMINEVGAYFSSTQVTTNNTASLSLLPQCVFHNVNFYTDTLNWMHLEATFVANGGEQYIVIGNFRNNITTDTIRRYTWEPLNPNPYVTYFYIDHVVLVEYTNVSIPNVFTPNNDGENDFWIFPDAAYLDSNIIIVNRWGNVVNQGKAGQFYWDGKDQIGNNCTEGVYYYRIEETDKTGYIHLIR